MTDGLEDTYLQPSEPELMALDAYIDARFSRASAPLDPDLLGAGGRELIDLVERLGSLSEATWEEVVPIFPAAPPAVPAQPPIPTVGRSRRGRHRSSRALPHRAAWPTGTRVLVAAVVLAVTVGAVAVVASVVRTSPGPGTGVTAVPASWRMAGFIDQPAWRTGGSAANVGVAPVVTCPSGNVCYAAAPGSEAGSGVVEISTDGGSTWEGSTLPAGWRITSALSCASTVRCFAGGGRAAVPTPGSAATPAAILLVTTDGGTTWSPQPLPASVAELTNVVCTSPTDCVGTGYGPSATATTAGPSVAVVTNDGGGSWAIVALPGQFVSDSSGGLACSTDLSCVLAGSTSFSASASRAAVLQSTDGGEQWTPATLPDGLARVRAVSCPDANRCVALGNGTTTGSTTGPYGPSEVLTSSDGDRVWSLGGPIGSGSAMLTSISCPTPTNCWASGELDTSPTGIIEASQDGGTTWTAIQLPIAPSLALRQATRISHLDVEDVSSVSCPTPGTCVALGALYSLDSPVQQIVLRSDGT